MELMFIQELQVPLCYLEYLSAEPPDHRIRGQQEITLDAIALRSELDPDHWPTPTEAYTRGCGGSSRDNPELACVYFCDILCRNMENRHEHTGWQMGQ